MRGEEPSASRALHRRRSRRRAAGAAPPSAPAPSGADRCLPRNRLQPRRGPRTVASGAGGAPRNPAVASTARRVRAAVDSSQNQARAAPAAGALSSGLSRSVRASMPTPPPWCSDAQSRSPPRVGPVELCRAGARCRRRCAGSSPSRGHAQRRDQSVSGRGASSTRMPLSSTLLHGSVRGGFPWSPAGQSHADRSEHSARRARATGLGGALRMYKAESARLDLRRGVASARLDVPNSRVVPGLMIAST